MPPKPKLHKNIGKSNKPLLPVTATAAPSGLTPEQEQQFELELCWCIQQLQNALKSEKLNNKQVQDHTKSLNALMSNSSPIIKKRQVMRLCFGDYRTKMAEEAMKSSNKLNIKVTPATPSKKSVFIKKAIMTTSDNTFKFNFPTNMLEDPVEDTEPSIPNHSLSSNINSDTKNNFIFTKSDNSFKFNFNQNVE